MPVELRAVAKAGGLERGTRGELTVSHGTVGATEVVAVIGGIGTTEARRRTERAIEEVRPDHVVVSGIAGGLDPSMRIGDLHVPAVALDAATDERHPTTPLGSSTRRGTIRTGDELMAPAVMMTFIDGDILSVDMETAAIGAVCVARSVPWTAFRGISDLVADGYVGDDVLALTNPDGSARVGAGLKYVLTHPHHVPRLFGLARGGALAAKVAAVAAVDAIVTME
jgi:adenosylhomocysteine nucleosidase